MKKQIITISRQCGSGGHTICFVIKRQDAGSSDRMNRINI